MNNKLVNSIKNSVYSVYATSNFRPSYWHEPAEEPFLHVTLGQLIDRAAEVWTDDEAFVSVYENIRLTFKEAREKADKLAAGFLNLGLSSGDVIAVWGSISSDVYLTLLAAARAGLTVAGVQPKGNAPELTHCLRIAKAKALVVIEVENDKNFCDILHEAIPELSSSKPGNLHSDTLPNLKIVITRSSVSFQGTYNFEDICRLASSSGIERVHNLQTITDPDETFIICFTSGSTGTPKAIAKSYHTVINISYETSRMFKMDLKNPYSLRTIRSNMYDSFNCPYISFGCTVIFGSGRYDPETSVKVIQNERCSSLVDVPTLYVDIISYVKENGVKLESLEEVFIGGALVTEKLAAEVLSVLNVKRIIHAYGMTESSMIGWHAILTDDMENISLLQLVKNYEVKVVDNQGRPVPLGMPGELWVRGYSVMKGYIDDEERTAECKTSDGWLKTGDLFILEENGNIRLVGRIKDIVIRDGYNIYPREVENFINAHPSIKEVHAIGVPDYRMGEELCVYISKTEEATLTEEDVKNYCRGKLSDYKVPRYIRFIDEFPRVPRGKVNKRILLELFQNDEEYVQQKTTI